MMIAAAGAATITPRGGTTATIARSATTYPIMAMIEAIARMIAIIAAMIIATSGAIAMNDATRSAACPIIIAGATGAARLDRLEERRVGKEGARMCRTMGWPYH